MAKQKKTKKKKASVTVFKGPSVLRQITQSEDFKERRKAARLDIPIKVQYKFIGKQSSPRGAVTKDMSAGGCLLLVTEELSLKSEVELEIFLGETDSEVLRLKGRLTRLNRKEKGLYEYGIVFDTLSSEARRLFADYCFAKMYEMIGLPEWPTSGKVKKS
ncbi:MAG: PilZ domain-containing protein [Candidatus Omnitrophota bacterium]|jgi:c-di-GMP-binding flagellar brake protein YcgR|nr:PilZ domain-containing protein [Candidatus Omnitrophota bacterium]|tara:strand:+ start:302 stop:781 length:480 start_codon:yes stop_codon:yes gene_type:complete